MTTLIICEKSSQASNVKAAVGAEKEFVICHAQGHLYRLRKPEEENPYWRIWSTDILIPPSGMYQLVPSLTKGCDRLLKEISQKIKTCDTVIIATDNDREGQAIGTDIVKQMKFKGSVKRAIFNNEDKKTLRDAIYNAQSNEIPLFQRLYDAADARRQADQIYNLSLTRIVTLCLEPKNETYSAKKTALGVGRVKTPTLGLVCEREIEINNFNSKPYYSLDAKIQVREHTLILKYKPKDNALIFDKQEAEKIASAAKGMSAPLNLKTVKKQQSPEKPMDITTLQKKCGKWGWSAKKVLETAQALYSDHKISSYPRTETRYLPEIFAKDAAPLLATLKEIYPEARQLDTPVIRKGKSGIFSDAGIGTEPHHAIIPNINMSSKIPEIYKKLSDDEKKLFDLIALSYLAAIAPDYEYQQTSASIDFQYKGENNQFIIYGNTPTSLGWKKLFKASENKEADDDKDTEAVATLPPLKDQEIAVINDVDIVTKNTKPPSRYTQGDLVEAMRNVWQHIQDPKMKERLKEAKGIGTGATRDSIIQGLITQKWLEDKKIGKSKYLVPTETGMKIYLLFKQHPTTRNLIDPTFTAMMEMQIDSIIEGKHSKSDVINKFASLTEIIRDKIISIHPPKVKDAKVKDANLQPSDAQLACVERIIKENPSIILPENYATDRKICSEFIGQHIRKYSSDKKGKELYHKTTFGGKNSGKPKGKGTYTRKTTKS